MRICCLNWRSVGLASIAAISFTCRSCRRACSRRSSAPCACASASSSFCFATRSARLVEPSVRRVTPASMLEMSRPPPLMMLDSSALRSPLPSSAALSGVLKYSAIPFSCTGVTELSSHISRKNAIIAVMKSA